MRAQLIQAGKLSPMGRMVASVAHEFNNPLQTIKNCLFLIQQDVAPDTQGNQFIDMAVSEVQRLSNLVAQLRAVYRLGATDQTQVVELSQVLDQVHSLVAPHLTKNQVRWEYTPLPSPLMVKGIPDQLKQVFLNLSLNASDAMQAKVGTLTVSTCVTADGRQAGVAFRDTGPGIDPRDLPNLFDPFFSTKESGMGLGLAYLLRHRAETWRPHPNRKPACAGCDVYCMVAPAPQSALQRMREVALCRHTPS